MPSAADLTDGAQHDGTLNDIALVFASGSADQNQALVSRIEAFHPSLPLFVVAEFQPHFSSGHGAPGEWIPWHVRRSARENISAIRAALRGHHIQTAAMALAEGTGVAAMRWVALRLCGRLLVAYDEQLQAIAPGSLPLQFIQRSGSRFRRQFEPGGRGRKWLRRMAKPSESEIPVRARAAQMYGLMANRLRRSMREVSLPATAPLLSGITVVIPSRDGRELLETMLPALVPQIADGEIIVVDNGSCDGTSDWLRREYPAIEVMEFPTPLSFARAVNAGIGRARFRRTLLLNNDMVVEPGFAAALENAFTKIPDLYCATAQIFFPPGVRREETGKAVWRREDPLDFPMRCDEPAQGEDLTWVFYGSGGCSLFDTAKLQETGGVSEVYEPAYVEDMDFGYRAWKRGWPSVFCAAARVEHRHRATTARFYTPRQLDFFTERNYLRFLTRAVSDPALFEMLWVQAIRRLQLLAMNGSEAALDTLRNVPRIGPRPPAAIGILSEPEILALGNGDVAGFPGRPPGQAPAHPGRARQVILIASPYLPFPLSHGGAVRMFNLMKHAADSCDIVLVAFCDALATPPTELLDICCEVVLVRRHGSHYRHATTRPDVVEEFDSATFRACLKQTAQRWQPAVVQLEFTWMAQYAGSYGNARTILVEHDVTFDLQEQLLASSTEIGVSRWELEQQAQKWRSFETRVWREVDCVVAMSAKDQAMVSGARSVALLPNGVDCERFQPGPDRPEPRRLLFIGSFAHLPNLLALEFFLKEVWPKLGGLYRLHIIAGANPEYFLEFHARRVQIDLQLPGVELEAFVSDVRPAYARAELVLAPLTASAGTNIKVLEAMAMGRAVIATPAGINGLDLAPGEDVVVESSAEAFAEAIRCLSGDPQRRQAIERRARATALRFDWSVIARQQSALYAESA